MKQGFKYKWFLWEVWRRQTDLEGESASKRCVLRSAPAGAAELPFLGAALGIGPPACSELRARGARSWGACTPKPLSHWVRGTPRAC